MDTLTLFTIVLLLCTVTFIVYDSCRGRKCEKCKYYKNTMHQEVIQKAADKLLEVADEMDIVRELRYEKECREALQQEIHDMFFFREFKYPDKVREHLEKKRDALKKQTWDKEEAQKEAKMYDELLEGLNPEWMKSENE